MSNNSDLFDSVLKLRPNADQGEVRELVKECRTVEEIIDYLDNPEFSFKTVSKKKEKTYNEEHPKRNRENYKPREENKEVVKTAPYKKKQVFGKASGVLWSNLKIEEPSHELPKVEEKTVVPEQPKVEEKPKVVEEEKTEEIPKVEEEEKPEIKKEPKVEKPKPAVTVLKMPKEYLEIRPFYKQIGNFVKTRKQPVKEEEHKKEEEPVIAVEEEENAEEPVEEKVEEPVQEKSAIEEPLSSTPQNAPQIPQQTAPLNPQQFPQQPQYPYGMPYPSQNMFYDFQLFTQFCYWYQNMYGQMLQQQPNLNQPQQQQPQQQGNQNHPQCPYPFPMPQNQPPYPYPFPMSQQQQPQQQGNQNQPPYPYPFPMPQSQPPYPFPMPQQQQSNANQQQKQQQGN